MIIKLGYAGIAYAINPRPPLGCWLGIAALDSAKIEKPLAYKYTWPQKIIIQDPRSFLIQNPGSSWITWLEIGWDA